MKIKSIENPKSAGAVVTGTLARQSDDDMIW
jgi:hypothetical protein